MVGPRNLTEFNYRMTDAKVAHLFVGVQIQGREEAKKLVADFNKKGFKTLDLTDDEMAKLHVRHLVGGRSPLASEEAIYRFEFPDRPGALMGFLTSMSPNWNISLFHYRNHGADVGRILVGLQVPKNERTAFAKFLKTLGYAYIDETQNPAYRLFLS